MTLPEPHWGAPAMGGRHASNKRTHNLKNTIAFPEGAGKIHVSNQQLAAPSLKSIIGAKALHFGVCGVAAERVKEPCK